MSYIKYYKYKKQVSYDDGETWEDVSPEEYAPSGDPIGTYDTYEDCMAKYRVIQSGTTCVGVDKHNLDVYEVSYDDGVTWSVVSTSAGTLIEADSPDCRYVPPTPTSADYLTFIAQEAGTFTFSPRGTNAIIYSTDNGATWITGNSVNVNNGDVVRWKGTMTPSSDYPNYGIGKFSSTGNFEAGGNVMSLLFGDNFAGHTSLTGYNYEFRYLFSGCTKITSAENMFLPATTLAVGCYRSMFQGCTSLTTPPILPATTLANYCYDSMFYGCTSLTTVPNLPATTLTSSCYQQMFKGCTSLTTAPVLSATTLTNYCYQYMFSGCTSLSAITCLATNISAQNCTTGWVRDVAASGTFTKATNMTNWATGEHGIPSGWTVVNNT